MSLLKPEASVIAGVAAAALAVGIYQNDLPTLAECRSAESGDPDLDGAEKSATWKAAAVVAGVSLLTKDPTIFVIGGLAVVALAWSHKYANALDPIAQRVPYPFGGAVQVEDEIAA